MHRCKETKKAKQDNKTQARQAYHHMERRKVCIKQTNIMEMCSHKWLHPNKPQEGRMDSTKQVGGPKDQQAQTHEGNKAWKEPRSRQTKMDLEHRSKQAYTCIKEMIQTL